MVQRATRVDSIVSAGASLALLRSGSCPGAPAPETQQIRSRRRDNEPRDALRHVTAVSLLIAALSTRLSVSAGVCDVVRLQRIYVVSGIVLAEVAAAWAKSVLAL